MPGEPTPDQHSIDVALSNFGVEALYLNDNFVANQIAPVVVVNKMTGHYFRLVPEEGLNIQHEEDIGHGGVATELNFIEEEELYGCTLKGKRHLVTDREVANADLAVEDYMKGDALIIQNLALNREGSLADLVLTQGNYHSAAHWFVCAAPWDADDSNPKDDIDTAVRVIQLDSGYDPNVLLVTPRTFDALTSNADVKDLIRYQAGIPYLQTGRIPGDMIYNLKIIRAGQVYDQNAPLQAANLGFIWENSGIAAGDDWAAVMYVDPMPSKKTGGFLHQFAFNMSTINDRDILRFRIYRDEPREGEWREARTDYDLRMTNNRAGAVITGLVTDTSS